MTLRSGQADDGDPELATRADQLSYIGGYTKIDIAKHLSVSRAEGRGMVKVFVEGAPVDAAAGGVDPLLGAGT